MVVEFTKRISYQLSEFSLYKLTRVGTETKMLNLLTNGSLTSSFLTRWIENPTHHHGRVANHNFDFPCHTLVSCLKIHSRVIAFQPCCYQRYEVLCCYSPCSSSRPCCCMYTCVHICAAISGGQSGTFRRRSAPHHDQLEHGLRQSQVKRQKCCRGSIEVLGG